MLKICTVYFDGKYQPKYVNNLYNSLKRYYKKPFEFICLSDTSEVEADTVYPLNMNGPIQKHWHKLKFFSPIFANQSPDDDIIVLDIDQVIVNDPTEMLEYPCDPGELVSYNRWWKLHPKAKDPEFNGGWYKFKSGTLQGIWDMFISNPTKWQMHFYNNHTVHYPYYGEQNFVEKAVRYYKYKITLMPPEWCGKYTLDPEKNIQYNMMYMEKFDQDYMIMDQPNPNLKIVHFANPNSNLHDCQESWLRKHW